MAKTLMSRPYILSSSSRILCCYIRQPRRPLVSQTSILLSKSKTQTSLLFSCNKVSSNSGFGLVGQRKLTTRATHVNDAGSIDSPLMQSMEKKIKEHVNAESVTVKDDYGDGRKIRLPESRALYTVLRSPHIDKKSREQFEMKIKKQFLVIKTERHELRKKFFWLKRRVSVESSALEVSVLNRQRMVSKAKWEELQSTVHAVDHMTTKAPAEAEAQK